MDHRDLWLINLISTLVFLWNLRSANQQAIDTTASTHASSACLGGAAVGGAPVAGGATVGTQLVLNCSAHEMVRLDDIYYGYAAPLGATQEGSNQEGASEGSNQRCNFAPGDCSMPLPGYEEQYACVGRARCGINLPTGGQGRYMPRCEQSATYMQADYTCVPSVEVLDICSLPLEMTTQSGYLRTPGYPDNYPVNRACVVKLRAPDARQTWRVRVIELALEERVGESGGGRVCADLIHIRDGHRAVTLCGGRNRVDAFVSLDNWVEIEFRSDSQLPRKGFWLQFTAEPYIEPTTLEATTTTSPTPSHSTSTTPNPTSTESSEQTHTESGADAAGGGVQPVVSTGGGGGGVSITTGGIAGVLVCIVLLIIILVFAALLCRRQEEYPRSCKMATSGSCHSEAAFLETTPPGTNETTPTAHTAPTICLDSPIHIAILKENVTVKMCDFNDTYEYPQHKVLYEVQSPSTKYLEKKPNNIEKAAALATRSHDQDVMSRDYPAYGRSSSKVYNQYTHPV